MAENPSEFPELQATMTARVTRQQRRGWLWWGIAAGLLALVSLALGRVLLSGDDSRTALPMAAGHRTAKNREPLPKAIEPSPTRSAADDDGEPLWVSPTAGGPIGLDDLPSGTQLILHVRVADLVGHVEGKKVIAALGPWGERVARQLTRITGAELTEIETLLIGIRPTRSGSLETTLRLRLMQPWSSQELARRLPGSRASREGAQAVYQQDQRACYLPSRAAGKVLVSCPTATLSELLAAAEERPLVTRELQRVLQRTDTMRVATLVFAGKFMQIGARQLYQGTGEPLRTALVEFLGDEATATALSAHWDDDFFLELQSTVDLGQRPHRFAAQLEQRVVASSGHVEVVVTAEPLHPYGRQVLLRFPAMLRQLGHTTRSGEEAGLSVLRSYLPVAAGHNLLMATELLLNTRDSRSGPPLGTPNAATLAEPATISQRLQQSTSLVFPKETLQRALEILSEDIDVPIEIAGRDLQLEGITKNQSLGLDLRDRPAAEILLAILERANPDRTSSGPGDVKQKLVYVFREPIGPRPGAIVVTTRTAAGRRGDKLPAVFGAATR